MFTYYDLDNVPAESKPIMENAKATMGMIPNLHRVMAESPITYKAYVDTYGLFKSKANSLSDLEQQVVMMTANFENNCHYCIPAHSFAMTMGKMPEGVIEALREGTEIPDPKLQELHDFAKALLDTRGHVGDERLQQFLDAGFDKRQALEVIAGLAAKLISNFSNSLTHVELDSMMEKFACTHPSER